MSNTVSTSKGMSTLVRPKFGPGMLLQHDDLDALQVYTRELNRLMFRSLFGCGVVCGLVVETAENCGQAGITVHAGVALNCSGDPIYVPRDQTIVIDPDCDPRLTGSLWVLLCGTSKCCGPRPSMCSCDDDEPASSCTRERYGFEIRVVREPPGCACQCTEARTAAEQDADDTSGARTSECGCVDPEDPCYKAHYDGECKCTCDECAGGGCDCVLLARLDGTAGTAGTEWKADHRVRRFVRPALIRDPQVEKERTARQPLLMSNQSYMTAEPPEGQGGAAALQQPSSKKTAAKQVKPSKTTQS